MVLGGRYMVLIAVIVGYILGVIPFILPKILTLKDEKQSSKEMENYYKNQENILNEWLNGKEEVVTQTNEIDQEDMFKEYVTGKETMKGD